MLDDTLLKNLFKIEDIGNGVTRIIDITNVCSYLIQGTERAALIDTCCGIGNIREVVEKLCKLPCDVILTHLDFDHSGGAYNFDDFYISSSVVEPELTDDDLCAAV